MPSRLLTNLAALASLSVKKPLAAAGFVAQPCGWRRVTEIGLKSVGSKFTLATFGVDAQDLGERVAAFVRDDSACNLRVIEKDGCCVGVPAAAGGSCFTIRTETLNDLSLRFSPPELCSNAHAGGELLNFVCRVLPDGPTADVWMQVHHAAADGVPMQELLGRLERTLGKVEPAIFPTPETWRTQAAPRRWHLDGDRPIEHELDFLDFGPLLECRKQINERRTQPGAAPATVGAVLVWHLSRHQHLAGKKFAVTVDIPATPREPRCVDLVVTRPTSFEDIDAYLDDFNAQVARCRARTSPTRRAMRSIALLSPRGAMSLLRVNAQRTRETFGTVGLSLLRETEVFLAPMSDPGFDDGFLAIGRMDLPTTDGRRVGAASIKGDPGKPAQLLAALRDALARDFCKSLDG
jgi:hypothetical protein